MVDADVLALPSMHEIFGLVAFEALMCGTPVVLANDCGAGNIIEDAGAGFSSRTAMWMVLPPRSSMPSRNGPMR